MTTLFISDLHLDSTRPGILSVFEDFIRDQAVHSDALYILGDLFEAWIGDDADDPVGKRFIEAMRPMRESRRPCFFMHGNRDFLIGERFALAAGMTLLPDPSVIELYGTPTLLMHGDSLCIDDAQYQAFRRLSRSPDWQLKFLSRSIEERRTFAEQARQESQRYTTAGENSWLMDVNQESVAAAMRAASVKRMIHGHTHRPSIHTYELDNQTIERVVLGDWYEAGSMLQVELGGAVLINLDERNRISGGHR